MLKLLFILISTISVGLSQVAPSYHPYSLIHPEIELPTAELIVKLAIQFPGVSNYRADNWGLPVKGQLK